MRKYIFFTILFFSICALSASAQTTCDNSINNNLWYGILYMNPEVKKAQALLTADGYYYGPISGIFNTSTEGAILDYQLANHIFPTGAIGSLTRENMDQEICGSEKTSLLETFMQDISVAFQQHAGTNTVLAVPLIEQVYPLSCETASLQMALEYRGIHKTQDELLALVGQAQPVKKIINPDGTMIWGDPDQGFVGDVTGYVWTTAHGLLDATGWGVDNAPIARVANIFREGSIAKDNATIDDVTAAIDAGDPVIWWHRRDDMKTDALTYTTPEGKSVLLSPNHVSLVVGYQTSPLGRDFIINDPKYGRFTIDEATFARWWGKFDNDMVIVK